MHKRQRDIHIFKRKRQLRKKRPSMTSFHAMTNHHDHRLAPVLQYTLPYSRPHALPCSRHRRVDEINTPQYSKSTLLWRFQVRMKTPDVTSAGLLTNLHCRLATDSRNSNGFSTVEDGQHTQIIGNTCMILHENPFFNCGVLARRGVALLLRCHGTESSRSSRNRRSGSWARPPRRLCGTPCRCRCNGTAPRTAAPRP